MLPYHFRLSTVAIKARKKKRLFIISHIKQRTVKLAISLKKGIKFASSRMSANESDERMKNDTNKTSGGVEINYGASSRKI